MRLWLPFDEEQWSIRRRGIVSYDLSIDFSKIDSLNSLIGHSKGCIDTGMDCLLYGRRDYARRCFERGLRWIDGDPDRFGPLVHTPTIRTTVPNDELPEALQGDEYEVVGERVSLGHDDFQEWVRLEHKALGLWLHEAVHDAESYARAAERLDRHYVDHPEFANRGAADDMFRAFESAGRDDLIDAHLARGKFVFREPKSPTAVKTERAMAWVLSRHRVEGRWTPDQVATAREAFLHARMDRWFEEHQYFTMAMWMKRLHWRPDAPDNPEPAVALRRCADYIPGGYELLPLRDGDETMPPA